MTVDGLLEMHEWLLSRTRLREHAGQIRSVQNWIGGSSFDPCSAAFVPPPFEQVEGVLADVCAFVNDDELPAVAQAAIAHSQFETIHPFVDGSGRTGRALIHAVLRRRGVAPRILPPISLVLAT
ncbi:MAG TPA: Fic family protein [Acidimicrobiales bacterium]|nr:Fic family protein [Acidimicrobiales bacterium]